MIVPGSFNDIPMGNGSCLLGSNWPLRYNKHTIIVQAIISFVIA